MKKNKKRITTVFLFLLLVLVVVGGYHVLKKEEASGRSFESALTLNVSDEKVVEKLPGAGESVYYKLELDRESLFSYKIEGDLKRGLELALYNQDRELLLDKRFTEAYGAESKGNQWEVYLAEGSYYVLFSAEKPVKKETYSYAAKVTPVPKSEQEPNNTEKKAQSLKVGGKVTGCLNITDRVDLYHFQLKESKNVRITLNTKASDGLAVSLFKGSKCVEQEETEGTYVYEGSLKKGTYYIKLEGKYSDSTGTYALLIEESKTETETEKETEKETDKETETETETETEAETAPKDRKGITIELRSAVCLKVGETLLLSAEIKPEESKKDLTLKWSTTDSTIVSVKNGSIKGIAPGSGVIEVTEADGAAAYCVVLVVE